MIYCCKYPSFCSEEQIPGKSVCLSGNAFVRTTESTQPTSHTVTKVSLLACVCRFRVISFSNFFVEKSDVAFALVSGTSGKLSTAQSSSAGLSIPSLCHRSASESSASFSGEITSAFGAAASATASGVDISEAAAFIASSVSTAFATGTATGAGSFGAGMAFVDSGRKY